MEKPKSKRRHMILRYLFVSLMITLLAGAIVVNAVKTTVVHADKWNAKANSVLNTVFYVQPKRGDILANDGTILATNLTTYTISLDYRTCAKHDSLFVACLPALSDSMAAYFPKRNSSQWKEYLAKPLEPVASKRKRAHVLLKDATYADYLRILQFPFFDQFKKKYSHGLYYTTREARMMPYGSMAHRSIGRCSYRPEAKFEGASKKSDSVDVLHGYSGLECALDSLLYGVAGTAKYVALTHKMDNWVEQPATDGYTLRTTIDINMQDIVENTLQSWLQTTRADWGTCLLMEVATGDIKAISNLDRDPKTGRYIEAMNYALQGFEPGSVMKPISMIVALEDKFAPLDRAYAIGHTYAYAGGSPIHDTHSPATLPVRRFIEYSSNIGMTKLIAPHYENNLNGFRERLRELGFFDRFNTGMAGERPPYFPTLDPKAGGRVSLSRMSYGYSTQIPPLYTCAVYNAIANKGRFVRPRMVQAKIASDGTVEEIPVSYVRDRICSEQNAKVLLEMLHSVVYGEGGTAKSLKNKEVCIVGKTGTCRIAYEATRDSTGKILPAQKSGYKENQYRLAFCGIFPYEDPKYTCMVLISNPAPEYKGAATTSGYVVRDVAMKMYAHGMLDSHADYKAVSNPGTLPTVYACDNSTFADMADALGVNKAKHIQGPGETKDGAIPGVIGLGMREALARIEDAGYVIEARGSGRAVSQSPAAGTPAKPGDKVKVQFSIN